MDDDHLSASQWTDTPSASRILYPAEENPFASPLEENPFKSELEPQVSAPLENILHSTPPQDKVSLFQELTDIEKPAPVASGSLFENAKSPLKVEETEPSPTLSSPTRRSAPRKTLFSTARLRRTQKSSPKASEDPLNSKSVDFVDEPLDDTPVEQPVTIQQQMDAPLYNVSNHSDEPVDTTESEQVEVEEQLPVRQISVSDPVKIGDITSAHIEYTVTCDKQESVQRRYRDFRWLYKQLQFNHPGRIVPPPPDKQAMGRFKDDFVEYRRSTLERMMCKIANNKELCNDQDFIMFLESSNFANEAKERERATGSNIEEEQSSSWFFSQSKKWTDTDSWFLEKKQYIDTLDAQLKGLYKNLEAVNQQRNELSEVVEEFSSVLLTMADLEISKTTSSSLRELSDTEKRCKELLERSSMQESLTLGSTLDEYTRVIGSIKNVFQQRESLGQQMVEAKSEEKTIAARQKLNEISLVIRDELASFDLQNVSDFRNSIEIFLESAIENQKECIELWETLYSGL